MLYVYAYIRPGAKEEAQLKCVFNGTPIHSYKNYRNFGFSVQIFA